MDGVPGMNKPKGNHKYDQILYWARTYRTAELWSICLTSSLAALLSVEPLRIKWNLDIPAFCMTMWVFSSNLMTESGFTSGLAQVACVACISWMRHVETVLSWFAARANAHESDQRNATAISGRLLLSTASTAWVTSFCASRAPKDRYLCSSNRIHHSAPLMPVPHVFDGGDRPSELEK